MDQFQFHSNPDTRSPIKQEKGKGRRLSVDIKKRGPGKRVEVSDFVPQKFKERLKRQRVKMRIPRNTNIIRVELVGPIRGVEF